MSRFVGRSKKGRVFSNVAERYVGKSKYGRVADVAPSSAEKLDSRIALGRFGKRNVTIAKRRKLLKQRAALEKFGKRRPTGAAKLLEKQP